MPDEDAAATEAFLQRFHARIEGATPRASAPMAHDGPDGYTRLCERAAMPKRCGAKRSSPPTCTCSARRNRRLRTRMIERWTALPGSDAPELRWQLALLTSVRRP